MILPVHLAAALGSVVYSSYLFFAPSRTGIRVALGLVGLTVVSGTWLIFAMAVPMGQVCVTGLAYVGYVSCMLVVAQRKLAAAAVR